MGLQTAKFGLSPLLFAQGKLVRKKIQFLPEPEGARSGVDGAGRILRLLVLGDSAAAGVGVNHQSEALLGKTVARLAAHFEVHWKLIAKTGATSDSTLRRLRKISSEKFDAVLISLGMNDVTANRSKKAFLADQNAILDLLRAKFGAALIVISGFPPVSRFPALPQPLRWYLGAQSRRFCAAIESLVQKQPNCEYLKHDKNFDPALMAADGFHPGATHYAVWAEKAAELIVKRRCADEGKLSDL